MTFNVSQGDFIEQDYADPVYGVATICHQVADYAGGIGVSFMQPPLFQFDIKCFA